MSVSPGIADLRRPEPRLDLECGGMAVIGAVECSVRAFRRHGGLQQKDYSTGAERGYANLPMCHMQNTMGL